MRALLQRVTRAEVSVGGEVIGRTGPGLMVLVCAMQGDDEAGADRLAARIAKLRIFKDEAGKMNHNLQQAHSMRRLRAYRFFEVLLYKSPVLNSAWLRH